ncbi:MAG TPA: biotin/lipoyl-containing protein, partial [Candidatus Dormibacteraeota bacterium]
AAAAVETRDLLVEVDGEEYRVRVSGPPGSFGGGGGGGGPTGNGVAAAAGRPAIREGTVLAPMQGLILKLPVAVGDTVAIGDTVAVLEAMKMQNDIIATSAGTVTEIYVAEGAVVGPKDPLLVVE